MKITFQIGSQGCDVDVFDVVVVADIVAIIVVVAVVVVIFAVFVVVVVVVIDIVVVSISQPRPDLDSKKPQDQARFKETEARGEGRWSPGTE